MIIEAGLKGFDNIARELKAEEKRQRRDLNVAVRVEGFRLMRQLKSDIRSGAPGGQRFAPLSVISRKIYHRGRNEPLRRLAIAVRYFISQQDPVQMQIGWTGPRVSSSWKRLAKMLQEGFTAPVSDKTRRRFRRFGADLGGAPAAKYFFLRRSTASMTTPARPIMDPFWRAQRETAWQNIRENFRRKSAGERI